jgi:FtsP/CotA-like multicopper oxidase with cupredoxin domain
VLTVTLEATARKVTLGGVTFDGMVYNGEYGGPTLSARPGDLMRVKLVNHLDRPTNLHFHGYRGSPLGASDNAHLVVNPGQSLVYVLRIPKSQPPGLYWYHAHMHGLAERQVMSGLSGMLWVEGIEHKIPKLKGVRHAMFGLKYYDFGDSDDPIVNNYFHGLIQTINGGLLAQTTLRPGETGLWDFANEGANLPIRLNLKGHVFRVIARDGETATRETVTETLTIPPAGRVEVLIDAGAPGEYRLTANRLTDSGERQSIQRTLAVLTVTGAPGRPIPTLVRFPNAKDLRGRPVDEMRTFSLTEKPLQERYFINGQPFDHHRIDTRVPLGNLEEWVIRNDSDDYHDFHIHQIGFQVIEVDGVPQPFDGYVDTVAVPERGEVKILMPFTDPKIVGQFMYHCHVLAHEDKGMMANIEVYDPKAVPPVRPFVLHDQFGHKVTPADFRGRPSLLFFGYSFCPDLCPTVLDQMGEWLTALGTRASGINAFYVTVDPQRDTVANLKEYLQSFDPRIRGLTGTSSAIGKIARRYGAEYRKVPLQGGGYAMEHSAEVYLLDADGKVVDRIEPNESDASLLRKLNSLAGG